MNDVSTPGNVRLIMYRQNGECYTGIGTTTDRLSHLPLSVRGKRHHTCIFIEHKNGSCERITGLRAVHDTHVAVSRTSR